MSESEQEAIRLLVECADELRVAEQDGKIVVSADLKGRLAYFFNTRFTGPEDAANQLALPL